MFIEAEARTPFDRSANIGFRCARYLTAGSAPPSTFIPISRQVRNYSTEKPPSDEIFKVYKELFSYDATPLDARTEHVDDSSEVWRHEKVSFNAAYAKERVVAHLFLPKGRTPPYPLVVYWPGSGAIREASSDAMATTSWDFLVVSGRAVLVPVYYGSYERNSGRQDSWPELSRTYRDWVIREIQDGRRALDYAATRSDLRRDQIGYFGLSWGARMGSILLSQEPRLKAAVFASGGLSTGPAPPEVDVFTFAPRVSVPVLMFNGESDIIFEVERSQKPLFQSLGTPAEHKRYVLVPGGHPVFVEKRSQFIREALDWFDRYLGPVR
jgi:dienelactone hydrolase